MVTKISSADNFPDPFTKSLLIAAFEKLVEGMDLRKMPDLL